MLYSWGSGSCRQPRLSVNGWTSLVPSVATKTLSHQGCEIEGPVLLDGGCDCSPTIFSAHRSMAFFEGTYERGSGSRLATKGFL